MKVSDAQTEFARWLETTRDLSPHTIRAYRSDIGIVASHMGPHALVREISGEMIVGFVDAQRSSGRSAASIRRRVASLRSFCSWLRVNQFLTIDPWAEVSLRVRRPQSLPRPVPASELDQLLAFLCRAAQISTRSVEARPLERPQEATTCLAVALMFATGLRVGEVVSIRCDDIDIEDASVCVTGKGSRERRVFLSDRWMLQLVRAYTSTRAELGVIHPSLLFNRVGAPLTPPAMRARLAKAASMAGLERRVTPHMLRHSAATQLIESGVDIRYVQRLLGHASLTTTEIYTHVSDLALRRVVSDANVLERSLTRDN